ncbi:MAG: acyl-ACP--UDP-N-acetylglucosamine O-acyltransferase [Candidatus Omnitrophica bacterium]|nr:acyl-ACP--UDP-N-acetylglucosamine O-acyltransferase [Candidatus Omnitrophota bacterium]
MSIHPTAIVSKNSEIDKSADIGPYAVVEDDVIIGPNCKLHAGAYVLKGSRLGAGCIVHTGACLGGEPQDIAFKGTKSYVIIGAHNVFREHVTVHRGTEDGSSTVIGDNNYFMCLSHIAHNCKIGNKVIICNNSLLAGHVEVEDMAFVSANCLIHQFVRIGKLSIIGGGVRLNKDFPPYMSTGDDNVVTAYNIIGLRRAGISPVIRDKIKQAYKILYRQGLNMGNALSKLESALAGEEIKHLADFIKESKRGVCAAHSNRDKH